MRSEHFIKKKRIEKVYQPSKKKRILPLSIAPKDIPKQLTDHFNVIQHSTFFYLFLIDTDPVLNGRTPIPPSNPNSLQNSSNPSSRRIDSKDEIILGLCILL